MASGELKKIQEDIKGVDKSSKDTSEGGLKGLQNNFNAVKMQILAATAVAVGFGVALKKTYDAAREGAELEYTQKKFDNLTRSINTTAEALLIDLKAATKGTRSEIELMASATDFMALGLANSHDEVVRLTTIAGMLNMNMNQLVLTLTNKTTMRFDALGVSVAGFQQKVDKLKESGMNADEAFNEAFLQQAEEQIARVGSVTEESISSFMKLDAAWEDLVANGKKNLVPFFEELAEKVADNITLMPRAEDRIKQLNEQFLKGKITYREYNVQAREVLSTIDSEIDASGQLFTTYQGVKVAIDNVVGSTIIYTAAAGAAAQQTYEWDTHEKRLMDQFRYTGEAIDQNALAVQNLAKAQMEYKVFLSGDFSGVIGKYQETTSDLVKNAEDLKVKIAALEKKTWLSDAQKAELAKLKGELDEVSGKIIKTAEDQEEATKRILLSYMEQYLGLDGLTKQELEMLVAVQEEWGLVDQGTKMAWDTMVEYIDSATTAGSRVKDIGVYLGALYDKTINIHTIYSQTGQPPTGYGPGGIIRVEGSEHIEQAAGGPIQAGKPYIWQEYGLPGARGEAFIPSMDGFILSRSEAERILSAAGGRGGGGPVYNLIINQAGAVVDPVENIALLKAMAGA